ncbi:hypothetical protein [Halorarius halobius]|nr:hypothetical protein [Halorarius halobius]
MPLEDDPDADSSADVADVVVGDGEILVYDTDVQAAWLQGEAVEVRQ